jgi:hypothetical protein
MSEGNGVIWEHKEYVNMMPPGNPQVRVCICVRGQFIMQASCSKVEPLLEEGQGLKAGAGTTTFTPLD